MTEEKEKELTIYEAYLKVQSLIKNPAKSKTVVVKHKNNSGSHEFKYAPLEKITETSRGLLSENGIFVNQTVARKEGMNWLETNLVYKTGDKIESQILFPEIIPGLMQDYGAKLTFLKRYGLCMALNISAEDDVDGGDRVGKYTKKQIKDHLAEYMSKISRTHSKKELMDAHGSYKEILDFARSYFPDLIYDRGEDGMAADEYFAFLFKKFRDDETNEASRKDMDKQHEKDLEPPK